MKFFIVCIPIGSMLIAIFYIRYLCRGLYCKVGAPDLFSAYGYYFRRAYSK